jgi:Flp pilus assembly pilin Flp
VIVARLRGSLGPSAFLRDRGGQDLVEYALLAALLATVAIAALPGFEAAISTAYSLWNTGTQNLWQPPNPGAGS